MKNLTTEERRLQKDAEQRRTYDIKETQREEREYRDSIRRMPFSDRLELKVYDDKANWFERWLYDNFFDPECTLPRHRRSSYIEKQAANQRIVLSQRIKIIASQMGLSEEEAILHYFRKLGEYVDIMHTPDINKGELSSRKNELNELFSRMLKGAILEFGLPYWIERDWIGGCRVKSVEEFHEQVNRRKNTPNHNFGEGPYRTFKCDNFLTKAGFKSE